jgi:Domain of unknown function (DUF6969)
MAKFETNPVLQVINTEAPLQENKKYPVDLLHFSQTGWRAYYHCHPASRKGNHRFQGEHGHFHIFVRINSNPEMWSHLVALAMDNMGQPLGWFTVNHWVTGEVWESATNLDEYLKNIPYSVQNNLLERWILSLVDLSRDSISSLLYERDKVIKLKHGKELDIKQDRQLYLLSEIPIHLEKLLELNQ